MSQISATRMLLSLATCTLACTLFARGQAAPTALRSVSLNVFAGASEVQTDYGRHDTGFMVGGDFSHHYRFFDPSLDLRFNKATGPDVGEKSFAGGIKIEKEYGRFHPYGHFLFGYGVITFDTPIIFPGGAVYSYDDSIIKDFGGGVDINLVRNLAVKVDGQYQFWKLGNKDSLNPTIVTVGIVYRIPYQYLRPHRF